ncbi:hypothetical protein EUGRSUZ_H02135 [Eucalyptus grandis]|uniref:Uncharacterized protein n=2 Tax=Eucalyptus grandis TaxID=71139 RepID=A0A059B0M6_EUCGR|nr:hypothetical protein EUGRSUZ_H02135 [Eucalyptus grandis]
MSMKLCSFESFSKMSFTMSLNKDPGSIGSWGWSSTGLSSSSVSLSKLCSSASSSVSLSKLCSSESLLKL